MIVVIAGASGLTGQACLQELIASGKTQEIIAISRHPLPVYHPNLRTFPRLDAQLLKEITRRVEPKVFICCLGTTRKKAGSQEAFREVDHWMVVDFAKQAKAAGAQCLSIVSAAGASPNSVFFYNRVKGEMELAVQHLKLPKTLIYHPSLLLGDRAEARPFEKQLIRWVQAVSPWIPTGLAQKIGTPVQALARLMIRSSLQEASSNQAPVFQVIPPEEIHE